MRKLVNPDVLEVVVGLVCDSLTKYSVYDVTKAIRAKFPSYEISHDEVREFVKSNAKAKGVKVVDNGCYLEYTNVNPSVVANSNPGVIPRPSVVHPTPSTNSPSVQKRLASTTTKSLNVPVRSEKRVTITNELLKSLFGFLPATFYVQNNGDKLVISKSALPNSLKRTALVENRFRLTDSRKNTLVASVSNDKIVVA